MPVYAFRRQRAAKAEAELSPASAIFLRLLAAQAELFDQRLVTRVVDGLDIVEQATAGRNKLQQATTGMVILAVVLEVLGQVGNALRQDRDLDFRRTGVVRLGC